MKLLSGFVERDPMPSSLDDTLSDLARRVSPLLPRGGLLPGLDLLSRSTGVWAAVRSESAWKAFRHADGLFPAGARQRREASRARGNPSDVMDLLCDWSRQSLLIVMDYLHAFLPQFEVEPPFSYGIISERGLAWSLLLTHAYDNNAPAAILAALSTPGSRTFLTKATSSGTNPFTNGGCALNEKAWPGDFFLVHILFERIVRGLDRRLGIRAGSAPLDARRVAGFRCPQTLATLPRLHPRYARRGKKARLWCHALQRIGAANPLTRTVYADLVDGADDEEAFCLERVLGEGARKCAFLGRTGSASLPFGFSIRLDAGAPPHKMDDAERHVVISQEWVLSHIARSFLAAVLSPPELFELWHKRCVEFHALPKPRRESRVTRERAARHRARARCEAVEREMIRGRTPLLRGNGGRWASFVERHRRGPAWLRRMLSRTGDTSAEPQGVEPPPVGRARRLARFARRIDGQPFTHLLFLNCLARDICAEIEPQMRERRSETAKSDSLSRARGDLLGEDGLLIAELRRRVCMPHVPLGRDGDDAILHTLSRLASSYGAGPGRSANDFELSREERGSAMRLFSMPGGVEGLDGVNRDTGRKELRAVSAQLSESSLVAAGNIDRLVWSYAIHGIELPFSPPDDALDAPKTALVDALTGVLSDD